MLKNNLNNPKLKEKELAGVSGGVKEDLQIAAAEARVCASYIKTTPGDNKDESSPAVVANFHNN